MEGSCKEDMRVGIGPKILGKVRRYAKVARGKLAARRGQGLGTHFDSCCKRGCDDMVGLLVGSIWDDTLEAAVVVEESGALGEREMQKDCEGVMIVAGMVHGNDLHVVVAVSALNRRRRPNQMLVRVFGEAFLREGLGLVVYRLLSERLPDAWVET